MSEQDRVRVREGEPQPGSKYDTWLKDRAAFANRQLQGQILIKAKDIEFEVNRQGRLRFYLHPLLTPQMALQGWACFNHDIPNRSGKHTHQGGNCMFVLEGKGYSIIDGERVEWEAGDLIQLPLKPGGTEHQHFNAEPGSECLWLAFVYMPWFDAGASELQQAEMSPEFRAEIR